MNYLYPELTLLVFSRPAIAGKCKTRLIPTLGKQGAADLQYNLLENIIMQLHSYKLCPFEIWQSEPSNCFTHLKSKFEFSIKTQKGSHLGQRMANAIDETLKKTTYTILIGSDCAEFSQDYLNNAMQLLTTKTAEVVIGPAIDGGYLLVGMSNFNSVIFQNIKWGSGDVLENTLANANNAGLNVSVLNPLNDIDNAQDLLDLSVKSPHLLPTPHNDKYIKKQ